MKNVFVQLQQQAAYHEKQASAIRKVLASADDLLTAPPQHANGHGGPRTHVVRRRAKRTIVDAVLSNTGKARTGHGIGTAIVAALRSHPNLTLDEIWEHIKGKFVTSSKTPRSLMSIEVSRLRRTGKATQNDAGQFSLVG